MNTAADACQLASHCCPLLPERPTNSLTSQFVPWDSRISLPPQKLVNAHKQLRTPGPRTCTRATAHFNWSASVPTLLLNMWIVKATIQPTIQTPREQAHRHEVTYLQDILILSTKAINALYYFYIFLSIRKY